MFSIPIVLYDFTYLKYRRNQLIFSSLLLTIFLFVHLSNFAQEIHFKLVERDPDNIGSVVLGMTQDADGFLWLATQNGLYRYDGHQYIPYHYEQSNLNTPASDNIECIAFDKAGYIWLGPRGLGLDRFDPLTGNFIHFRHDINDPASLVSDTVSVIMQDSEGTVWIGTIGGLERFDSKTNKFVHYRYNLKDPSSLSCDAVRTIYEDKSGTIWVGTGNPFFEENTVYAGNGGLNKLNKKTGGFVRFMHDDKDSNSLVDNRIRATFEDSHGTFWIGTAGDGLHTMDRTRGTFKRYLYDSSHPEKLSRPPIKNVFSYAVDHITFFEEDNKGRILIGTFEGGMNVYDYSTNSVTYYGSDKSSTGELADNELWATFKTRDNVIWISTWKNTLYKIIPYQTTLPNNKLGKTVHSFAEDEAQTLWIGTTQGLVHKAVNKKDEKFLIDKDSSAASNNIYYLDKDSNKFWIATFNGLYLFDPFTKKILSTYHHRAGDVNSLLSDTILVVKKGTGNALWLGSRYGLSLLNTKSGVFSHFRSGLQDSSISDNRVYTVDVDKNKNVWAGTYKGLNRLDKQFKNFKRYLDKLSIFCIEEDSKGDLWCGTRSGLFKYDNKKDDFFSFTDKSSILTTSLVISWIIEDYEHNLWINTSKGIVRLNKERDSTVLYGKNQGVSSIQGTKQNGYACKNGEILYGDTYGYYDFNPHLLRANSWSALVAINKFLLKDNALSSSTKNILSKQLRQKKEIALTHNQNTFSIEFSSIDFISDYEDTRIFYALQNYDNVWRRAVDEKIAYYYYIPPGKYIFKVKVMNAAGVASEEAISINIQPPWWNTWWAYTIFAALFVILLWYFIAYLSRKLKRENKVLEEKVNLRTQLIEAAVRSEENERNRIGETLHNEIGAILSSSKLHILSIKTNTLDDQDKQLHEKGRVLLDEVILKVRGISHNLLSDILRDFGLNEAIRHFINSIVKGTLLRASATLDDNYITKNAEKDISIYRVIQELVNNIIKYADAGLITINSTLINNNLEIILFHNGNGISQQNFEELRYKKEGLGLKNIQNRIILLKGKIEFLYDETGYRISIKVPANEQVL